MLSRLSPSLRRLARRPGFFFATVLLIALGTGASTTAFTLVHTLFYKARAGLVDADAIANVHRLAGADDADSSWSYPDYQRIVTETRQFAGLAAFTGIEAGFSAGARSQRVLAQLVSANLLPMLGTAPEVGRFFLPAEETEIGAHPVVVISDRLWREYLGADPAVVGRSVKINGEELTVIGVAARNFHGTFIGFDFDVWLALGTARQSREFGVRLALGAQPAQIVSLIARRVAALTGAGLLLGGALAGGTGRLLQSFLPGISPVDPLTYAAAALALAASAAAAAWLPAHRASRADPLTALRAE